MSACQGCGVNVFGRLTRCETCRVAHKRQMDRARERTQQERQWVPGDLSPAEIERRFQVAKARMRWERRAA